MIKSRPVPDWTEKHDYTDEIILDVDKGIQTYVTKDDFNEDIWAVFKALERRIKNTNTTLYGHLYQ